MNDSRIDTNPIEAVYSLTEARTPMLEIVVQIATDDTDVHDAFRDKFSETFEAVSFDERLEGKDFVAGMAERDVADPEEEDDG